MKQFFIFQDVFQVYQFFIFLKKTSWKTKNVTLKTSLRRRQDIFSTSSPRQMFAGIDLASNFLRTYQLIGCSVYNIYLAVRHISTLYFLKTHSFINNDTLENCAMDSKSEI